MASISTLDTRENYPSTATKKTTGSRICIWCNKEITEIENWKSDFIFCVFVDPFVHFSRTESSYSNHKRDCVGNGCWMIERANFGFALCPKDSKEIEKSLREQGFYTEYTFEELKK